MTLRMFMETIYRGNGVKLYYSVKLGKEDIDDSFPCLYIPKDAPLEMVFREEMLDMEIKAFAAKGKDEYVIDFEKYT